MKTIVRKLFISSLCTMIFCLTGMAARAQDLENVRFVTEELPPFSFVKDGRLQGIGVDVLLAAMAAEGVTIPSDGIEVYPWARAYRMALDQPDTCLFVTYRSPEREDLFRWAGPISDFNMVVISKKDRLDIEDITDLRRYTVGTLRDGAGHQYLQVSQHPVERMELSADALTLVRKIDYGRINALIMNDKAALFSMRESDIEPSQYETNLILKQGQVYFAFSKKTPQAVVKRLQRGIDAIRADGTLDRILSRYLD